MNILVILGDSLALPRPADGIDDTDTYSLKLAKNIIVINKSQYGNNTIDQLNRIEADVAGTHADFYTIQLGIVDCSPRIFSDRQKKLLSTLSIYFPRIIRYYIRYKTKNRYQKTRKKKLSYTSINQYAENIQKIIDVIQQFNNVKKIFLINIAYPSKLLKEKNYNIENIIEQYNERLNIIKNNVVTVIDLFSYTKKNPNALLKDEHISIEGHDFIAKSILEEIIKEKTF